MMQPIQGLNYNGAPIITLAGREWFMPTLAVRQNRVIVPRIATLLPMLQTMGESAAGTAGSLSEEHFDAIIDVVYAALTRAYPHMSKDEFLDTPMTLQEMLSALTVIMKQTGLYEEKPTSGEAEGALTTAPPSTSIESSHTTAIAPESHGRTHSKTN